MAVLVLLGGCNNNSGDDGSDSGDAVTVNGSQPSVDIMKIGDDVITSAQLSEYMVITALYAGVDLEKMSEAELEAHRESALEAIITNTVVRHYMETLGAESLTPEIMNSVEQIYTTIMSNETLIDLARNGVISDGTLQMYIAFCQYMDWFYTHVMETVDLSDNVVQEYYDNHRDEMIRTMISAAHIVVGTIGEAEEILDRLGKGESFESLVQEFTMDISTREDGIIPDFGRNETLPEFEEAVYDMEIGEIRGPVLTYLGYHIIRLDDRYVVPLGFDIVEFYIRDILVREACNEKIRELRQEASITHFN